MTRHQPLLFVAGGLLAAGLALSSSRSAATAQEPEPAPAPRPVDNLALVVRIQELEKQVADLQGWVASQRAQAKLTATAVGEAEAAGFTAGINPRSREVLLAAWRAAAEAAQEGGAGEAKAAAPGKGRGARPDGGR